jgi:hypothetical protein
MALRGANGIINNWIAFVLSGSAVKKDRTVMAIEIGTTSVFPNENAIARFAT